MATKPPPGKGGKPFLGEDDLLSELDAWDATFDALHGGPAKDTLSWPAAPADPAPDPTIVSRAAPPDPTLVEDFDPVVEPEVQAGMSSIDEQMTLDGAVPEWDVAPPPEPVVSIGPVDSGVGGYARAPSLTSIDAAAYPDPDETDFSAVGGQGAPAAIAPLLGRPTTTPPPINTERRVEVDEIDIEADEAAPIDDDSEHTQIRDSAAIRRALDAEADDEIFTSASRPRRAPLDLEATFDDDDVPAPPPPPRSARPTPPTRPPSTSARTGPAIVRRVTGQVPVARPERDVTPPGGADMSMFAERTRVQTVDELEVVAAVARQSQPTAPPMHDDDAYDDIEIDADASPSPTPAPTPLAKDASGPVEMPAIRRTAHVVRRDAPTRPPPPPGGRPPTPGPVIELDVEEPPIDGKAIVIEVVSGRAPTSEPASEDDFSDVAAAVRARSAGEVAPDRAGFEQAAASREIVDLDALDLDDDEPPIRAIAAPDDDQLESVPQVAAGDEPLAMVQASEIDPDGMPTVFDKPDPNAARPPAMMDLYPRVKTPTSVPPLGIKTMPGITPPVPLSSPSAVGRSSGLANDGSGPRTLLDIGGAPPPQPGVRARLQTPLPLADAGGAREDKPPEREPQLDLDTAARAWPEQVKPLASTVLDEQSASALLVYEREVATLDDSATSAALRIEAGRLCERLADLERARMHYDAALLADPRATAALRGLRRIARASGDLAEATRHLDTEIAVAGALERRPLGHYRIDLLMASGEQDLARVAVGEILDSAPSDIRALLAQLELAFLDGRADEFGIALEQIANAVTDHELRAAVQSARGVLAAHHNDTAAAAGWFAAAAESDPQAIAARLGAVRHAAAQADGEAVARALLDVARQVESTDPITAAAAAIRAQQWLASTTSGDPAAIAELAATAAAIALVAAPSDPLVARLSAEAVATGSEPAIAAPAFADWARTSKAPSERAYAAARAAELDPAHGVTLWTSVLEHDPGDDYAAAQLRTAHVTADATQAAIDVDLALAADPERDRARLRAAYGLIAQGKLDAAIVVLDKGRAARPGSIAIAEALGEALAAAGKWSERAVLFADLAREPGDQIDRDIAALRSAIAWEEAVGAATQREAPSDELQSATAAALEAWERVLEQAPGNPTAHAAAIVLANRMGDRVVLGEVLARAQAAERAPLAAASLAFRRARLIAQEADSQQAEALLRDIQPIEDPRRTVALVMAAARAGDLLDAAAALEERANLVEGTEAGALRLRAAQLALDAGDASRATRLLQLVEQALPTLGVVPDLLAAARRRAGDRPTGQMRPLAPTPPNMSPADAFTRVVRDADLAAAHGDPSAALALYQRALELKPGDPLATVPLVRVAIELRDPAPLSALALAQLKLAEDADDNAGKAAAYELLAQIDADVRADTSSAQIALESASQADPSRIDLMHRLEQMYSLNDEVGELVRLRKSELETIPVELVKDRVALQLDIAGLATRDGRPEVELAEHYRAVLETDPGARLALLHLESIVRRAGASADLARLEEQIATYFEGDPKAQAAFWTRAGETLAEINLIDEAVQRFGKAEAALPGHVPALEGWRQAALKGALWVDVAEAAQRQAAGTVDLFQRAQLYHFAGVALMDKALVGEQAMSAFRRALEADPSHRDAFLRLRILLEEDANHDDLAILLRNRLEVETERKPRVELHRALAELHRNFLSDRETATRHYRAILEDDPNDLRSHAAVADIAWEQGNWQDAADSLMARARLERTPEILKTLCFRLGLIYADRLVDIPMALKAFQRALTYQPDDENVLVRLADLAAQIGEWKLALGACERLVKNESDADRRVAHLHRVAKIFKLGFGDTKRAERALNLALDSSPTNDEALQQLVAFYKEARDITSVRVHLNRVTGAMRARVAQQPLEGVPYRVIARAMAARAATGAPGSAPIARAAAQLADMLGAAGEGEQKLIGESPRPDLSLLSRPESDEVLFPRGVQPELRQLFQLLGDRVAKHVGVNVQAYGVSRGDRVRAKDNPVAAVAQSIATGMGFSDIDVYISTRQPWVMVAEPTSPVSLILGSSIAQVGGDAIRFAAGGALKMAQASLAIPARLPAEELGVLVTALLRLFQPDFPVHNVDPDAVTLQFNKLRRLIPTNLLNELRPYALAIDGQRFDHHQLSRDLKIAGLRAGLVTSGSLLAGLRILASQTGAELPGFLADPLAQGLVSFALGEDHAAIAR